MKRVSRLSFIHFICFAAFLLILQSATVAYALTPAEIFNRYSGSVVTIYSQDALGVVRGGSGFFVEGNGGILTNSHVIANAEKIMVKLKNDTVLPVQKVVAQNQDADLALLQVNVPNARPLSLATQLPRVGESVIVIGAPFGYSHTLTDGLLSAVGRGPNGDYIQISAPISRGSSGSPVFDASGKVIGIATLSHRDAQNLNFAPSIDAIKTFLREKPAPNAKKSKQQEMRSSKKFQAARNGNFLYRAGAYKDGHVIKLQNTVRNTVPGPQGSELRFEITAPCTLQYAFTYNNYEFYGAPRGKIKEAPGKVYEHAVGIVRDPKTGGMGWYVNNARQNEARSIWTRALGEKEFPLVKLEKATTYDKTGTVRLIKFVGVHGSDAHIEQFSLTRGTAAPENGIVAISLLKVPGQFKILGGLLDIDRFEKGVLYYDWVQKPKQ